MSSSGVRSSRSGAALALVAPPPVELLARRDLLRHPIVEQVEDGVVRHEDVGPSGLGLQGLHARDRRRVAGDEVVPGVPLPQHQRVVDEELAGPDRVDPAVGDTAGGDDRQPVQRHSLVGHRRGPPLVPPRVAMAALHGVARGALDPFGLDAGDRVGPQPVRLDEFSRHHPAGPLLAERRRPAEHEARLPGPLVLLLVLVPQPDVREEPREKGLVHAVRRGGRAARVDAEAARDLAELRVDVLPLPDPQPVEVLGAAALAELVGRHLAAQVAEVVPEVEVGDEVRVGIGEASVGRRGRLLLTGGALPWIDDRQGGGDHQHLAHGADAVGLEHHPAESRVDRKAGQAPADLREPHGRARRRGFERAELLEQGHAVGDAARVGRFDERERRHLAETDARHLEDDGGQVGAQDLGFGELGAGRELVLGVQPDADSRRHSPAPAGPLVGRGLRHRLDRQALHLRAAVEARDAGRARIDHVADARDGERRLGHVRGQHDATATVGREHPVLLGRREPRVERQDLRSLQVGAPQGVGGVADVPLA